MINIVAATKDIWWITRNSDNSAIHYGSASIGESVSSGQPISEPLYYNEEDWLIRLAELGIDPIKKNNEENE